MPSPAVLHVSRALREHGLIHLSGVPGDEYDCCAEVAIESYKDYVRLTKRQTKDVIISNLLNDTGAPTYGRS